MCVGVGVCMGESSIKEEQVGDRAIIVPAMGCVGVGVCMGEGGRAGGRAGGAVALARMHTSTRHQIARATHATPPMHTPPPPRTPTPTSTPPCAPVWVQV